MDAMTVEQLRRLLAPLEGTWEVKVADPNNENGIGGSIFDSDSLDIEDLVVDGDVVTLKTERAPYYGDLT